MDAFWRKHFKNKLKWLEEYIQSYDEMINNPSFKKFPEDYAELVASVEPRRQELLKEANEIRKVLKIKRK